MIKYSRTIIIIIVVAVMASTLTGCGLEFFKAPRLEVRDAQTEMIAGDSQILNVYNSKTDKKISDYLLFASSDPSVVTVDDSGKVEAVSQGSATIYIQHSENKLRTELTINVTYNIVTASRYNVKNDYSTLSGDLFSFWSKKGYQKRVGNWDILDIAKILITKDADDYLFSDVYGYKKIEGEEVVLLSDWGNNDVYFDENILDDNLLVFIEEKYQVSPISDSLLSATNDLKTNISNQINAYHGSIRLSTLPSDMEYRIYISYDYDIVKVNNFYSRGKLLGLGQLGTDILNGKVSSFLDSYTYSKTEYEIVNAQNATIVIEGRVK